MIRPHALIEDCLRAAKKGFCLVDAVCLLEETREVVETRVVRPEVPLVDCQRTAIKRLGLAGAVRVLEQGREIVEPRREIGMIRPVSGLPDR